MFYKLSLGSLLEAMGSLDGFSKLLMIYLLDVVPESTTFRGRLSKGLATLEASSSIDGFSIMSIAYLREVMLCFV
jgi:hypothetical protein